MSNMKKSLEEQSERMQKFNSEQIALHEKNKTEEDLNGSVSSERRNSMTYTIRIENGHHVVTIHEVKHNHISANEINIEELDVQTFINLFKERDDEITINRAGH